MSAIIQLNKPANTPTNNTSAAGGAMSGTQITNAGAGEWCPQLVALQTGVVDTDIVQQIQEAYIYNAGSVDWSSGGYFSDNQLIAPTTPGIINLQSTSASDDNTLFVRVWGVVSGLLIMRDITLNGFTLVSGTDTFTRIERLELRVLLTPNVLATATGRITASIGSGSPQTIGAIPAPIPIVGGGNTSYSYATYEHEYAIAGSLGDTGTYANRITDPFGGGGTWVRPNTIATMLALPATLTAGTKCAIYRRETLQPGIGSANPMVVANKLYGTI